MAVAQSNSNIRSSIGEFNCYRVANLTDTILDSEQVAHLEDQYQLGEQLGWGQFGIIRSCSDKLTGEVLACKSIARERLVTAEDLRSVKLEIEIMARLSGHPNVVNLKAVYEDEDYVHLVMELCAGGELFHRLEKHGRFSESEARVLFKHLMLVVMYCHDNGIVHRDLKPENILLATKSSSSPIKLADFGLATYIEPGQSLHGTVGSPFYIAPEVLAGGYNQAADVWSAGVILYILLSGIPPFWGKTKSRIFDSVRAANLRFPADPWDDISESAKDLITGMLCTDPAQRLTAAKVLDHSWMKDSLQQADESCDCECESISCSHLDLGSGSFSTPFISRNQDISFGSESPLIVGIQGFSPAVTCKSSFSSFLVEAATPCSVSGRFSFSSCCESNSLIFSSPVSSMPSFAFFGPSSPVEQLNNPLSFAVDTTQADGTQKDNCLKKFFMSSDSSICLGSEVKVTAFETQRGGGPTGSKALGIRSKRNRTIGLGEFEQLDLMVTESIIRWASCTHLPSAASLRSSLVC
ncbi:hypothetical protein AQUCO_01300447v1 [Aquilegia coerulea]|uniref:non-specific serine/threonine protein kinase n=1 Tax=Aquilegia coerulea TaxID=218851 RepID=A0A2G5E1P7_AQUCA|nr:hypothetical protein AQUCO_01300447v1 [Aquilegia coerulea]